MTNLGEIIRRSTTYNFTKNDVEGFTVKGNVTFDKDNNITDVNGSVYDESNNHIANFNSYNFGENPRYNINDCKADLLQEVSSLVGITINELKELNA